MSHPVTPFFWFDMQAEEAAKLYTSVFKNSSIDLVSRYGKEGFEIHKIPAGTAMTVNFKIYGKAFTALNGGPIFKINPSISMFVLCESESETKRVWNSLVEDGKIMIDIGKHPWSNCYGWLQDKFGMTWQISVVSESLKEEKITPSFLFTKNNFGKAEEAIQLYTKIFPNSSVPMLFHNPPDDANEGKVLFSHFILNGNDFIAMDGPGVHDYEFNEGVSLQVFCDTQEEIDHYWYKLIADGGSESQCGWLKDKFGVSWQIVPSILGKLMSDPSRAGRVTNTFLKMRKFEIEKLLSA